MATSPLVLDTGGVVGAGVGVEAGAEGLVVGLPTGCSALTGAAPDAGASFSGPVFLQPDITMLNVRGQMILFIPKNLGPLRHGCQELPYDTIAAI
ncbi:MAG: hypothetical protein MUF64_18880 [Polyangiaceae bacterium]|jgi:hypothetical protein|nr:hypothetical protein [Polyangiaceae bacterium]